MTTLRIQREYPIWASSDVELPEGRTWNDIESCYVKWEVFFYKFKDEEEWRKQNLSAIDLDQIDLKWPKEYEIGVYDENDDLFEEAETVATVKNW